MSSLPNSTDKESADPIARSTNRKIILIFALIIVGFVFWKYYDHYIRHNYDAPCVGCSCFVPLAGTIQLTKGEAVGLCNGNYE